MHEPSFCSSLRCIPKISPRLMTRLVVAVCIAFFIGYLLAPLERFNLSRYSQSLLHSQRSKNAFAVLLGPYYVENVDQSDMQADEYFQATRILNYQLRHSRKTRYHNPHAPFLVLVTSEVAQNKREILEREGATIVPVEKITVDWVSKKVTNANWGAVLTKLQLWTFEEYERILLFDSDTMLMKSLDGVFEDPAAQPYPTNLLKADNMSSIPTTYTFGGIPEGISGDRANPANKDYLNAGFLVMQPDMRMYNYYMDILSKPDSFNPDFPEQNLFNHAHRQDGPMPWKRLDGKWNTNCPSYRDYENGYKTLHARFWSTDFRHEGSWICLLDPKLGMEWWRLRGQMEAFYSTDAI